MLPRQMVLLIAVFLAGTLALSGDLFSADLIVPRSGARKEEAPARPVTFKIVNRGGLPVYLQGIRQGQDHPVLNFFHREGSEGWKPFIDYLPCDLPQCHEMGQVRKPCPKAISFPIPLGAAGATKTAFETLWEGRLYDRREAMVENNRGQYCYRPFVPTKGTLRVEVEYSANLSEERKGASGRIGPREKSAIEITLPPSEPIVEIPIPPAPRPR